MSNVVRTFTTPPPRTNIVRSKCYNFQELQRESKRLMEERRAAKESEAAGEREFWAEQREREAEMERVVEEERMKLLKSHASRLIGHLGRWVYLSFLSRLFFNAT